MLIHIVKKGDVLWQLADYYEANINNIIEINSITNPNLLLEGQSLLIPTPDILYTVRYGDTLWRIAHRFGVPLIELLSINRIVNPNLIYPGVTLTIPQEPRPPIEVNAFAYVFGITDIQILSNTIDYLTYLTPFSYIVEENGDLMQINDDQAIQLALSNNVIPIMSITNYSYNNNGQGVAHTILNNLEIINALIDNIINVMKDKRYQGLKICFENVMQEDRESYNNFLQMISSKLHEEGYFVATVLPPKQNDVQTDTLYGAYDYEAQGRIVDYVVIKNFETRWTESFPGAAAPIVEIRGVLNYAISVIPRDKIFFGYEIIARDWVIPYTSGMKAANISVQEAINRAYRNRARIQYDERSQSPFYFYRDAQGRMHEVWFEDARSAKAKFDIVKEYGLRGISYWALGYPFPQNWHLLEDNFMIVKS